MSSRADAYRAKNQKTVTIDGLEWTIRKVPPMTLGKIMEVTGIGPNTDKAEAETAVKSKLFEIAKIILPPCTINPHISLSPVSTDELSLDDLTIEALNGLLDAIYEFSGIGAEEQEKRENFRPEQAGPGSSTSVEALNKAIDNPGNPGPA